MNSLKRAAELLQNSAEEFESPDGLSICVGIDAWNDFFETLDSELARARAAPVNQQMLEALNAAKIGLRDWEIPENRYKAQYAVDAAIAAAEASGQENHQAEPVAGQCKFSCESKWLPCSVEHHYHVLSCPDEWPGYETRLLYTAPQPSVPPGWKLAGLVAPTIEAAREIGAKGGEANDAERLAFEAWMAGHCWSISATWNGTSYVSPSETVGYVCPHAMRTRQLWAAWRDRAALAAAQAQEGGAA
ncbi:hypothetical protein LH433_02365 [Laribacter hongkongensis]|uniref:hypothetical protein n=1 Tax=Laribacter hongkongensis TaxID=168471 RepID=UPI001EFC7F3C|nr:hypothetical protein [Laribacter hongkongensis]MCG9105600.1 hypothetical protein [Laribacter hongkongensis]